jgi:hypothetical protein
VAQRISNRKVAFIGRNLCEEHPLEHHVADFAAECLTVPSIDRVEHFVGLLEDEASQRLECLLPIPRTSARPAQACHDRDERFKLAPRDLLR